MSGVAPCGALLAAVTAAGASSRMGQPKALLALDGTTLLGTILAALARAGIAAPCVVTGAEGEAVAAEARRHGGVPLWNAQHRAGRFTSIRAAARWARAARPGAPLLLWPVDCPGVAGATLAALGAAALRLPRANVVPSYDGRGGHPVLLCPATLDALARAADDGDLREFVRGAPGGRELVAVDDPAVLGNLNTPADYAAFGGGARG